MKSKKSCLLIIAVLINYAAFGQVSVTGTAYTEIVPLATISETLQLNFGKFSPVEGGGKITISPQGIRLANGSVVLSEGPFSQGTFKISGSENSTVSILLPGTPQLLYNSNTRNTIYMDNWTYDIPKSKIYDRIINIGATINFKSSEANPAGFYTGTYQIIFFYN